MSSVYQPKRKELANVKVVNSEQYKLNHSEFSIVGVVHRGYSHSVTTQRNKKTGKCSFLQDTCSLTKKTKNDLVRFFSNKQNNSKQVAYLVVPKSKYKK